MSLSAIAICIGVGFGIGYIAADIHWVIKRTNDVPGSSLPPVNVNVPMPKGVKPPRRDK